MSRRNKKHEEHVSLDRWVISYADFITLLFAFFVVMYSISSVNEGKYRVLSDTLNVVFESRPSSLTPIELDEPKALPETPGNKLLVDIPIAERSPFAENEDTEPEIPESEKKEKLMSVPENPELDTLSEEISDAVKNLIDDDLIKVKKTDFWLEIDIKSSILFRSGEARLSEDAEEVLATIANLLNTYPNEVQVEGFTDDRPINSTQFPSNWELSSSRAASVVHLFEDEGVDPKRMQAIGYGQYRPIADNTTAAGRNENRRVNLVVLGEGDARLMMQQRNSSLKQNSIEITDPDENNQPQYPIFNPIFDTQ